MMAVAVSCDTATDDAFAVNDFYVAENGGYARIPLLKPLQLYRLDNDRNWYIDFSGLNRDEPRTSNFAILSVDSVQCSGRIILGVTTKGGSACANGDFKRWFTVDLNSREVNIYNSRSEIPDSVSRLTLGDVDSLHREFLSTHRLPWTPDSISQKITAGSIQESKSIKNRILNKLKVVSAWLGRKLSEFSR